METRPECFASTASGISSARACTALQLECFEFVGSSLQRHRRSGSCHTLAIRRTSPTRTTVPIPSGPQDINGVTVEHPVVTATGEVPPVLNTTCTPQDGEIAQEPRPTATDENVNYSVTGVEAPQAASEDTAATDEAEAREGPPTTTLDRSRDGSFLKAGTPHVVAATAILEGEATGGPPPAVPNENQGEPTLLMAGDESTGAIDKAAVSSTTGDEPGDDGVIEQPPIAAVSQTAEAGGGEDGPPIPKQAEEAIAEDAIAAPVESIALNAEVESTSETGQTSVALEVSAVLV